MVEWKIRRRFLLSPRSNKATGVLIRLGSLKRLHLLGIWDSIKTLRGAYECAGTSSVVGTYKALSNEFWSLYGMLWLYWFKLWE